MTIIKVESSGRGWALLEKVEWPASEVTVPVGYKTDFDSVPRIPIFYAVFKNRTRFAAVIHDYLYSIGHNRKDADRIFLAAMEAEGIRRRYRLPIYWAVRIFGKRYHHSKK